MLRDNRKFQFAVGVTAIVIVIRWLLTGDLLMAVEAARPPAEGETKSLTVLSVVGPMLIEACVIIGAALIAWAVNLWGVVVALVDQAHQVRDSPSPSPAPSPVSSPATTQQPDTSRNALASGSQIYSPGITANTADGTRSVPATADPRGLIDSLAKAVAVGDAEAESSLKKEIRKPYLRLELGDAVQTANWVRAREIIDELESMESGKPVATRKRSGSTATA